MHDRTGVEGEIQQDLPHSLTGLHVRRNMAKTGHRLTEMFQDHSADETPAGEHMLVRTGGEGEIQKNLPRSLTGFHVRRNIARDMAKTGHRLTEKTSSFFHNLKWVE